MKRNFDRKAGTFGFMVLSELMAQSFGLNGPRVLHRGKSLTAGYNRNGKPHQGESEKARRRRQMANGTHGLGHA